MAVASPGSIAELFRIYDDLRCPEQAIINRCSAELSEIFADPFSISLLISAYADFPSDYYKRCILLSLKYLLHTRIPHGDPETLRNDQNALMVLLELEKERTFQIGLALLVLALLSQSGHDWVSLDPYLQSSQLHAEVHLIFFASLLSSGVEDKHFLELCKSTIDLGFRQEIPDQIMAFSVLGFFQRKMENPDDILNYGSNINRLFRTLITDPQSTPEQISRFISAIDCFIENGADFITIEAVCPTLLIIENLFCSPNYSIRVILRDYLNRRFLYLSFDTETALNILDRMIDLSIWFFSVEIDEATVEFDDFRGVFFWYSAHEASRFVCSRIEALLSESTPERICCALDLIRGLIARCGASEYLIRYLIVCLEFQVDFQVRALAMHILCDYSTVLQHSLEIHFTELVNSLSRLCTEALVNPDQEKYSSTVLATLTHLIAPGRAIEPVLDTVVGIVVTFFQRRIALYDVILLIAQILQTHTNCIIDQYELLFEICLSCMASADPAIRSVVYYTIPCFAVLSTTLMLPHLRHVLALALEEGDRELLPRVVEMFGRLVFSFPDIAQSLDPVVEMAIGLQASECGDDQAVLVGLALFSCCGRFSNQCIPIVFSLLFRALESGQFSTLPQVLELFVSRLPEDALNAIAGYLERIAREPAATDCQAIAEASTMILSHILPGPRLVSFLFRTFVHSIDHFLFQDTDRKVQFACRAFLRDFFTRCEGCDVTKVIIALQEYTQSLLVREIRLAEPFAFDILAALNNRFSHLLQPDLHSRALESIVDTSPEIARSACGFVGSLPRHVLGAIAEAAFNRITSRLTAPEPATTSILLMRDALISGLCTLNRDFQLLPADAFVDTFDRFLPIRFDLDEFGNVYSYLCDIYESCCWDMRMKYLRWFVELSAHHDQFARLAKRNVVQRSDCCRIFRIIADCLDRYADPSEIVADLCQRDENQIDAFRAFLNFLTVYCRRTEI
jgi:hypothetical protein